MNRENTNPLQIKAVTNVTIASHMGVTRARAHTRAHGTSITEPIVTIVTATLGARRSRNLSSCSAFGGLAMLAEMFAPIALTAGAVLIGVLA